MALHAVCGMGTIKDAAIAASTNRVFLHPRYVLLRIFTRKLYNEVVIPVPLIII